MSRPDRIIIFSDVHLSAAICNQDAFRAFVSWLAQDPPDRLVIAGDLLDLWRRSNAQVLTENREVLAQLFGIDTRIDYIAGNHDYAIWDVADRNGKDVLWPGDFRIVRDLRFCCGDHSYYVTHGYDLDVAVTMEGLPLKTYEAFAAAMCRADNSLGGLASLLWDAVSISGSGISRVRQMGSAKPHDDIEYRDIYDVAVSGAAHLVLGAHPRDRLVFGHTHWPFCSGTVANTGSWCTEAGVPLHNTYIEITPKKMVLQEVLGR